MGTSLDGHKARKRFGQNFLVDSFWIDKLARAVGAKPGDDIVEIGPGKAALTRHLLDGAGKVRAVEIDRDLAAWLRSEFPESLTLIEADALTIDWKDLAEKSGHLRIVGNLPYNISSPLLFALLPAASCVLDQHFMLQREVVDRIADAAVRGKLLDRSHVLIDIDDTAGDYTCRVEAPLDLDAVPVE